MATDLLAAIRRRINMGDREGAKLALLDFLKTDPDTIDAWALLAILLREPVRQAECYRQILRIDPENRQAAMWLEALSRQIPDSSARVEHAQPIDSVLTEFGSDLSLAEGARPESGELDQVLEEIALSDLDPETRQLLRGPGHVIRPSEQGALSSEVQAGERSLLGRMVSRLTGSSPDSQVSTGSAGRAGATPRPRQLTPDEIIQLAGGPLSPEERRSCPKCGAVVSRSECRCPWCSEPLSTGEAE
jgi:hypothetical protein